MLFGSGSMQDPDNSDADDRRRGTGRPRLPDRDYYTKDDAKSKEIREHYLLHVQKMFELLGDPPETAKTGSRHRDAHRDRTGQGLADARGAPRSLQR